MCFLGVVFLCIYGFNKNQTPQKISMAKFAKASPPFVQDTEEGKLLKVLMESVGKPPNTARRYRCLTVGDLPSTVLILGQLWFL